MNLQIALSLKAIKNKGLNDAVQLLAMSHQHVIQLHPNLRHLPFHRYHTL